VTPGRPCYASSAAVGLEHQVLAGFEPVSCFPYHVLQAACRQQTNSWPACTTCVAQVSAPGASVTKNASISCPASLAPKPSMVYVLARDLRPVPGPRVDDAHFARVIEEVAHPDAESASQPLECRHTREISPRSIRLMAFARDRLVRQDRGATDCALCGGPAKRVPRAISMLVAPRFP